MVTSKVIKDILFLDKSIFLFLLKMEKSLKVNSSTGLNIMNCVWLKIGVTIVRSQRSSLVFEVA